MLKKIEEDPAFELRVFVTGVHLSPEFGSTFREIEVDGFRIDAKVEILLSCNTPVAVAKSMGIATIGFAEAYARHRPDMVLMLGDRYELLATWRPMHRLPMYQGCPRMQTPVAEDVQARVINLPSGPTIATAATREQRRL